MVRRFQGKLPILLSALSVVIVVALTARSVATSGWTRAIVPALYLAWLIVEAKVAAREVDRAETRLDRGTLELYAAGRALTVILALAFGGTRAVSLPLLLVGAGTFAFGVGLRLVAIRALGRFYSHRVRVSSEQTIIDTGPYRFMRHPAYTGMLLAHAGFVVACFHPAALVALLCVFVPAVVLRIRVEECALLGAIPGYAEYCRGRARLLPLIW